MECSEGRNYLKFLIHSLSRELSLHNFRTEISLHLESESEDYKLNKSCSSWDRNTHRVILAIIEEIDC